MENADTKINRGSEWRKWDLHLHSFYTSLKNDFQSSNPENYIQKIKSENIKVVGLTNYFNFNEDDWNLKSELESEGILVFLNLELRLTYINKEDDCCDLHFLFSNELSKEDINTFLTKLNCSILDVQKPLSAVTTENDKKVAVVEFSKILETLSDPSLADLKEKMLIGMLSRGKGSSRSSKMYEALTKDADFVIHSTDKVAILSDDVLFWSGHDVQKPIVCKALFQSSDAHGVDKIGLKYTWVKGDTSFETFKQAIVDFENRISIQDRNPSEKKNSSPELFIDNITYKNGKDEETLYFSKDINSIIGKRGAGKSVLLKHIAQNIVGEEEYIKRHKKKIEKFQDFNVHWCDGKQKEDRFVDYIPQNYLSTITYEDGEKFTQRDEELRQRLFNNELFKNADDQKRKIINSIELKIVSGIKDILLLQEKIIGNKELLKSLGQVEGKKSAIKIKEGEVEKFGVTDITETELNNQSKYSLELEELNREISLLGQDIKIIEDVSENQESVSLSIDSGLFVGLSSTTSSLIERYINETSSGDLKSFLAKTVTNLKTELRNKEEERSVVEKKLLPINEKLKNNEAISSVLKEINTLKGEVESIQKLDEETKTMIKEKTSLINEVATLYLSFEKKIQSIVDTLKDEFKDLVFIMFDFTVSYMGAMYKKDFFDVFIDARYANDFNDFVNRDFNAGELTSCIEKIVSGEVRLKTVAGDKENALIALLNCRYDIDFTKSVKYKDGENIVNFENMTGGQASLALLDLIFNLSKSNYPIIIDQPENDIDVSGISNELSKLIQQQKERRQVIIATHSPNLLLLTDSENIIVAGNENNILKYHNGGIEDLDIQEDIVNILEGGPDALRKRMLKLNARRQL